MRKKITKLWGKLIGVSLILFMVVMGTLSSVAQNIAPLATATGNGSGTFTPYLWNWNRINDLSLGTCGGQEAFIWTTSPPDGTEYMEWDWNQTYPINKITIHHGQTTGRFLTGGTIQYWNGSTWVNHFTFSGLPQVCINDITFPIVVTDKLRIANWVPGTGQNSNLNFREIQIWQGALPGTHALAKETSNLGGNCGGSSDSISVEIQNIGLVKIGNFYIGTKVSGTVNGSPVTYNDSVLYTDSIATGQSAIAKLYKFNSINGANLDIVSWARVPNDTNRNDDTVRRNVRVLGSPTSNPTPSNNDRCGSGSVGLTGGAVSGNTVYWYDQAVGGNLMGTGNTFNTPNIAAPNTVTYYAAGVKQSGDSSLNFGLGGSNYAGPGFMGGSMFDLVVNKPVTIDSLSVHLNLSKTQEVVIYVKQGSYSNATTNPSAWTLLDRVKVLAKNFGSATNVPLTKPVYIQPGTYGIYVFADENLIFETIPGSKTVSNTALTATMGIALRDTFATSFGAFGFNGQFFYHEACVSNTRIPVTATAKPLPVGGAFTKGTTFQGKFDAGTIGQPDIVANPDQIEYSFNPPTGFVNSGYGTGVGKTWNISSITVETTNGTTVPSANYTVTNPSSTNGTFLFKPTTAYTDSTVVVRYHLTRNDNGCDSTVERIIFVAPRPVPGFSSTSACEGDAIEFTNTSTISSGTMKYDWDFADGSSSDLASPFHSYTTGGNYQVKLIVTSNYGYKDSSIKTVNVYEVPKPNFDFVNACEGAPITFTDASTLPGGAPTYVWNFGNGSPNGTGATTAKQYAQPGIYAVTLFVEVNGCSDKITKYVTQAPRAIPAFTVDLGECDNKTVGFKNASTAPSFGVASYLWKFGDLNEATGINVNHTYFTFNTYTATLYAQTDLGCVDSITSTVTLKESPKADFAIGGGICTNESVLFTNNTNVPAGSTNTYEWAFGDANTSQLSSPTHSYPSQGTYTIELKSFSTNGCEGKISKTITVGEKPMSDFVVNKVCAGSPTIFTNNSTVSNGVLNYQWDLGNGTTPTTTDATTTYASAGSYTVSLIASGTNGCSDTTVKTAEVSPIPAVDIIPASTNTGNGGIRFATSATNVTYKWFFGDGGTSDIQNPTYIYPFASKWTVRLVVVSPDGCVNSTTTDVVVNPLSVNGAQEGNFVVYPNPTSGLFYVKYDGQAGVDNIKVTDVLGKVIANYQTEIGNDAVAFDLSSQSAGVYFITLTDVSGNSTFQKVTITR